jgi:hypothetical protein
MVAYVSCNSHTNLSQGSHCVNKKDEGKFTKELIIEGNKEALDPQFEREIERWVDDRASVIAPACTAQTS